MIVAVVGSRTFNDYQHLSEVLKGCDFEITGIVSGGAKGADSLAERYAKEHNIPFKKFLPDWESHGRSAGFIRNLDIVGASQVVIAFWDGKSKGTRHSIYIAHEQGKRVITIMVGD